MTIFINFLKKDNFIIRISSLIILIFIIYSRSHPGSDQLYQIGSAFNFIKGNGFSEVFFDGNVLIFKELNRWPRFYSLLISLFLFFSKDPNFSFLVVEFICYGFFLLALYKTLSLIFKDSANKHLAINLVSISLATSIAPFKYGTGIDVMCVSVFLFSAAFMYKYYFETNKPSYLIALFIGLAVVCQMRYDYLPKVLMFFVFIIIIEIIKKDYLKHLFLKILLSFIFLGSFFSIYLSAFFQTSSPGAANLLKVQTINFDSYWNVLYAPFINSYFPDFVIYTFISKVINSTLFENYYLFVALLSLTSLIVLILLLNNFRIKQILKNLENYFLQIILLFFCFANLITLVVVYGLFEFYNLSWIENPYTISYSGLSVVNRYFLLFHVSVFLLSLYYGLKLNNKFFKFLIFCSVIFGFTHFCYLFSRYSIDKAENLKLVSKPSEIYIDCQEMNTIFSLENDKTNLFIPFNKSDTVFNRQIRPSQIAMSNGFVIFNSSDSLLSVEKLKSKFDNIYICNYSNNNTFNKGFETIYEGKIYSLHKKINDQQ